MLAPLVQDLGVSLADGGHVATAYGLAFAVGAPVLAARTARFERKSLLLSALLAMTVAGLACAVAPNFPTLVVVRIFAGLAAAIAMPLASGMAAALVAPEQRGRALAVVVLGMTIAFVLGIPLGTVVGGFLGWRATFGFAALLAAAALAVAWVTLPKMPGVVCPRRSGPAVMGAAGPSGPAPNTGPGLRNSSGWPSDREAVRNGHVA